ncbi:MAG: MBL fold metallo-hydrolase [Clostridia bacterium]
MLIKHFYVEKIAHSSYLIAGNKSCAIIDPSRDIDKYLEEAYKRDLKITHIIQTHLHADFVSGHMDLAKETGAEIYMPKSANANFPTVELVEGDSFEIEDIKFEVLETPGHTPEHICYVVYDLSRSEEPSGVFTGDTLFVGDVGRPDLFPDKKKELADKLFDSLRKLMKLPDYCEVYPAHGAGSLCGKAMAAKYRSTIGYEKRFNPLLNIEDRNEFIKSLTENMPEVPDHFALCSDLNRQGPTLIDDLEPIEAFNPDQFYKKYIDGDAVVIDVRSYICFGGAHIPESYSISFNGNLPIFAGWIIPFDKDILLVAENDEQVFETMMWLQRVGLDRTVGYLKGGIEKWVASGYTVDYIDQLNIFEAIELVEDNDYIVIDTREKSVFSEFHIPDAINISSPDLRERYTELDMEKDYLLICKSGNSSNMGASILKMKGFDNISVIAGGMKSYEKYLEGEE